MSSMISAIMKGRCARFVDNLHLVGLAATRRVPSCHIGETSLGRHSLPLGHILIQISPKITTAWAIEKPTAVEKARLA